MNDKSFHHLLPGNENSSTMSSEHATYTKVPPANEVKMISTKSDALPRRIPIVVPIGVAQAKMLMNLSKVLKSILLFIKAIEIDMLSANL